MMDATPIVISQSIETNVAFNLSNDACAFLDLTGIKALRVFGLIGCRLKPFRVELAF
jgi:hypothetical protein